MAIIIDGAREEIPGIRSTCYLDDSSLGLTAEDCRNRSAVWIRGIVLHTTRGIPGGRDLRPQVILPGIGASSDAGHRVASCWAAAGRAGGAHLVVDYDGQVSCCADLLRTATYHAGAVNNVTIGIEVAQGSRAELYAGQLDLVVQLVDWLTKRFGIQRQIPDGYHGPIERLELGARDFVGVFGHRDSSNNRGQGDPGDEIFRLLEAAGYERWDLLQRQDIGAWKSRQHALGIEPADGVPGPMTVVALAAAGHRGGLWVPRPGDAPLVA